MTEKTKDGRQSNGGHSTKGRAGRKKANPPLVKITVRVTEKQQENLKANGDYNALMRELIDRYFAVPTEY